MAGELKDEKLDFWIKHNYNVLLVGRHGVGKTAVIKSALDRAGLRWRYFSASTLDPWVDLVGVPKEVKGEDGVAYLDLVRPKEFQYDEIDAVFFDEFNRSHKKVRNAVMELLQFKSINGKKFNNLKIVWAAINPEDEDEYDVEKLDPAQEDRFHIKVEVPYKPVNSYFVSKYGAELAKSAISWWSELPDTEKKKVSPRRLDYALDIFGKNGDIRDALPDTCGVAKLLQSIKVGPISLMLEKFLKSKDVDAARAFLSDENNLNSSLDWINKSTQKNSVRRNFYVPLIPLERISQMASRDPLFLDYIISGAPDQVIYAQVINDIVDAGTNKTIVSTLKRKAKSNPELAAVLSSGTAIVSVGLSSFGTNPAPVVYAKSGFSQFFSQWLRENKAPNNWNKWFNRGTNGRIAFMEEIVTKLPPQLSVNEALETLDFMVAVAGASHIRSIENKKEFKNFMGVVNHCISEIHRTTSQSWEDIRNNFFQKRFARLYEKIGTSHILAGKLLCPKNQTQSLKVPLKAAKVSVSVTGTKS